MNGQMELMAERRELLNIETVFNLVSSALSDLTGLETMVAGGHKVFLFDGCNEYEVRVRKVRNQAVDIGANQAGGYWPDIDTSEIAAKLNGMRNGTQRDRIARAYFTHPEGLTYDEAAALAGVSLASSPEKRTTELHQWGIIRDTGNRRETCTGTPGRVYALTPFGREILQARYHGA